MALYVYTAQEQPGLCQYYERQEEDNEDEEQQGPLSTGFANLISNSDSINQLARKGFTPVLEVSDRVEINKIAKNFVKYFYFFIVILIK